MVPFSSPQIHESVGIHDRRAESKGPNCDSKYHIIVTNVKNEANTCRRIRGMPGGDRVGRFSNCWLPEGLRGNKNDSTADFPLTQLIQHLVYFGKRSCRRLAM